MKKCIFHILSLLILLPALSNWMVVISFKINQDEIAKSICIRKNILKNNCQGVCNLKEQLKKIDELSKLAGKLSLKKLQLDIAFFNVNFLNKSIKAQLFKNNFPTLNFKPNSVILALFQPPNQL